MRGERDDPVALVDALPACLVDESVQASRQRQYPRELLISRVVELMMLVSLGLRPSLHTAVKTVAQLPPTLAALYEKVKRTELQVLRALLRASAVHLETVVVLDHRIYDLHPGAALRC